MLDNLSLELTVFLPTVALGLNLHSRNRYLLSCNAKCSGQDAGLAIRQAGFDSQSIRSDGQPLKPFTPLLDNQINDSDTHLLSVASLLSSLGLKRQQLPICFFHREDELLAVLCHRYDLNPGPDVS